MRCQITSRSQMSTCDAMQASRWGLEASSLDTRQDTVTAYRRYPELLMRWSFFPFLHNLVLSLHQYVVAAAANWLDHLCHCQKCFGRKTRQVHRPGVVLKQIVTSCHPKTFYFTSFTFKLSNSFEPNTKMFNFLNILFHVNKSFRIFLFFSPYTPPPIYFREEFFQCLFCLPNICITNSKHIIILILMYSPNINPNINVNL